MLINVLIIQIMGTKDYDGRGLISLFKLGVKTRFSGMCLKQGKDKLFLPIYTDCAVFLIV